MIEIVREAALYLKLMVLMVFLCGLLACQLETLIGPVQPGLSREMDFVDFYQAQNSFQYQRCVETVEELEEQVPADTPIRKEFLDKQILGTASQRQIVRFTVRGDDLKRRMLLNVRHSSGKVTHVKGWLNGLPLAGFLPERDLLNAEIPDMVYNLCRWVEEGENTLELEIQGPSAAQVEIFITGLMELAWIPGQDGDTGHHYFNNVFEMGEITLRIFDGLNVHYDSNLDLKSLQETSGISLYPLQYLLNDFQPQKIIQGEDFLNQYFYLSFSKEIELQNIMDTLLGFPFLQVISFRLKLGPWPE